MAGIGFELKKSCSAEEGCLLLSAPMDMQGLSVPVPCCLVSYFCWGLCFCVTGQALRNRAENYWSA